MEESRPERVVLIHIQNTWYPDGPAGSFVCIKRFVIEQALKFPLVKIGNTILIFCFAETAFATIAGDILAAAGEAVYCEAA